MSEQITIDVTVTGETIINEVAVSGEVITTVINEAARGASTMPIVKSASFTADNGLTYHAIATLTVTDPTPESGKGFTVLVRNGTSTVGGTAYATAGTVIIRTYHSGAWANYVYQVSGTFAPLVHTHVSADITDSSSLGNSNVLVKYGSQGNLFGLSTSAPALSSNATTSGSGITATANTGTAGIFASTAGNHLNAGNGAFVIANNGNVTGTGTFTASNLSGTNTGNETDASIAALITAATSKATPVDADEIPITDSAASFGLKKLTWANLKATAKTYFDTLYVALTGDQTIAGAKTFSSAPIISTLTASSMVYSDASKNLVTPTLAQIQAASGIQVKASTAQIDATSNVVPADITGLTGYILEANTTYRLEFLGKITSGASGGYLVTLAFTQNLDSTTTSYQYGWFQSSTAGTMGASGIFQDTASTIKILFRTEARTASPLASYVIFKTGSVAPTAALKFCQNASNATTSSILTGAVGVITKLY